MRRAALLHSRWLRRLRAWGAGRLLARVHRITQRLPVELRAVERARVLVVAPHMDDEVIAPGGTLLLHRRVQSEVGVIFCSDSSGGKPGSEGEALSATRRREAKLVTDRLGLEIRRFLDHPDGGLSRCESDLAAELAALLREAAPQQIFCPFPADHHRDHQATAMALARATRASGWRGEVWCYEVWSPLWPNVAVDISEVAEEKRELIGMHASQAGGLHYVEGTLGLNRYRGLRVDVPYAEAFYVCRERPFQRMADQLNKL